MTYASANRRPNPAALLGALGIPGAFGALLVVGLAVTAVTQPAGPRIKGVEVDDFILPPPPPEPTQPPATTSQQPASSTSTITSPEVIPFEFATAPVGSLPGLDELSGPVAGQSDMTIPPFTPPPALAPRYSAGAAPRGNPGKWVTNDDYRSRWIMEELSGTARFTLAINASGKVTGCTVTRSTGHAVLDQATCRLVTKRARFEAARDGNGKAITGSYSGTITWKIPQ